VITATTEIGAVQIVDQREYVAADRHPWSTRVTGLFPGIPEGLDLCGLLNVETLTRLVVLQRGALQVHAKLRCPPRGRVGSGSRPNPLAQPLGEGFEAQLAKRILEHRPRVRLRKTLAP